MHSRLSLSLRSVARHRLPARPPTAALRARALATTAADASTSTPAPPPLPTDPALNKLVDDISALTLLQAADLVTLLKTRLNIQEIALPSAGAPAAAAAPAEDAAPAEEAKPKEKTIFNVTLESFDAGAKPKIIKEVKALVPNLTLIEAKKFVESVPKVLKEGLPKEDAEKIQKVFEAHGAVVKLD
ncbi:ribosomal protein L7/L12 C-terminal domain-containing protein [Gloeopeniophorella convolvens]|nr:ribosomal protein L7/L12 C-terminal domain-containing protein [Gloeopeniophorella convolvens]